MPASTFLSLFLARLVHFPGQRAKSCVRILQAEQTSEEHGAGIRWGYLFNRFLLSSEHMCSNTFLENMWVGEFGLGSLPDGTLHSPHHKTISRGLTELPTHPIPLSEAQKCPYDSSSPPNLLFALIWKQEACWQKGLAQEKEKKNRRNEREEQSFERRMWKTWDLGLPGGVQYLWAHCIKAGTS